MTLLITFAIAATLLSGCVRAPTPPIAPAPQVQVIATATSTPTPKPTETATSTPTPKPTATATSTPTPLPAIPAAPHVRECLFNPDCSGLFKTGRVSKAAPLIQATRTGYAEYTLVNGSPTWQSTIRKRIMPTLARWTATEWREFQGPGEPGPATLSWLNNVPHDWPLAFICSAWHAAGCAIPGHPTIVLYESTGSGVNYPAAILYDKGLHEAVHALYDVHSHTSSGLMCVDTACQRPYGRWPEALNLQPIDEHIYTLYGNPLLTHGMSQQTAELIIQEH